MEYKSRLSSLFDNNEKAEDEFRANAKCEYAATELAYAERFLKGETDLKELVSPKSIELIKHLTQQMKEATIRRTKY